MKLFFNCCFLWGLLIGFVSCSTTRESSKTQPKQSNFSYLALGDSYTIGERVDATENFPHQLYDSLRTSLQRSGAYKIIARTGWTTTNLLSAIEKEKPLKDYDLVTLLIGVNNQYQGKEFSVYENEFPKLLKLAIQFARGDTSSVLVVSIPDYAYTPFGEGSSNSDAISTEIDRYNAYAKRITAQYGVPYQNITDVTRLGLENPELVASDGLHPSGKAYKLFVDRLIVNAKKALH